MSFIPRRRAVTAVITTVIILTASIAMASGLVNFSTNLFQLRAQIPTMAAADSHNYIIPILDQENPDYDISLFKQYLRSGDILVFPISQYSSVQALPTQVPGLHLATGGTSVNTLSGAICLIPNGIDYITYDYENGHTPEYTQDQNASEQFFDTLHLQAKSCGKKLIIAPVWISNPNWNWGEVATHTDVLIVQLQNFQTNANVPDEIKPSSLHLSLSQVTQMILDQVRTQSPSTKVYVQFGFDVNDNPRDMYYDIQTVQALGVDGVVIWYNSGMSGATAKFSDMQQILKILRPDWNKYT